MVTDNSNDPLGKILNGLDAEQRTELARHLIGFVTWSEIVTRFGLRPECLLDQVPT